MSTPPSGGFIRPVSTPPVRNRALLRADAKNRTYRTFLQALAVDVALAVALVLTTSLSGANAWGDLQWTVLGFLLAKTVVVSAASYVMRAFLDTSSFPTPLPPSPQAAPTDPV